ncbi:MAG: DUF1800 domain-containing protein [Chloroflexota bacterium]|nr:DUF1800 domain-containing protein [Chloroflexota bacterium]
MAKAALRGRSALALVGRAGLFSAGLAALRSAIAGAAATRSGVQAPLVGDRDRVAHLLRRAGFGYSPESLDAFAKLGVNGTVDALLNYQQVPDPIDERLRRAALDLNKAADMQRWWLLRMAYTERPLLEKMTLFWHGLLVSGTGKVGVPQPKPEDPAPPNLMLDQIGSFRDNALADFGTILKGISRNPAMIVYLDSRDNRKGKPNENYARELMELFTLGVSGPGGQPPYSEQDVREVARAFTGWGLDAERKFLFRENQHDAGAKTIFGKTGNFGGDAVIDLILEHPACAPYICRRLFSFFAYDDPQPGVLAPIVETFRASKGSIRAVVRAILTSGAFYSERAYRANAKSPAELVAGVVRALQLETDAFTFQTSTQRMGQTLFNPPNVAGWPGGGSWFNTSTWLERVNWVNRILTTRKDDHTQPVDVFGIVQRNALTTPEQAVDYFLGLLLDGQARAEQRQALLTYVKEGSLWKAGQTLKETDPAVDRKLRGLVYLIMAMPEYQLN